MITITGLYLEAFRSSYTSLFEAIVNNASAYAVKLYDTLNNRKEEIVDVSFSRTVNPGRFLFCRIVWIQDFAMTFGAVFIFGGQLSDVLVRRYRSWPKSRFVINESVTRFILFQSLNRELGEPLELYEKPRMMRSLFKKILQLSARRFGCRSVSGRCQADRPGLMVGQVAMGDRL